MKRFSLLTAPAKLAICVAALSGSTLVLAQETVPAPSPPVVAPAPSAAPSTAPAAPMQTARNGLSGGALGDIAIEDAERRAAAKPVAKSKAAAPVRVIRTARAPVAVAPAEVASVPPITAPEAQLPVADDITAVSDAIDPIAPAPVEPVLDEAPTAPAADNAWMLYAAIAGALGLAGLGLVAAGRRRRRVDEPAGAAYAPAPEYVARAPVVPDRPSILTAPVFAQREEAQVAKPIIARPAASTSTDPLFAQRPVDDIEVTDPLFTRPAPPPPPVTDPLFADHDDYVGRPMTRTKREPAFAK